MIDFFRRILRKNGTDVLDYSQDRKVNLLSKIDFVLDTLHMNKFDIFFMESLKMPLSQDQEIYFTQQIDRINGAIKTLCWIRENVESNDRVFRKLLPRINRR